MALLATQRKVLAALYLLILTSFLSMFLLFTSASIPQFFHTILDWPGALPFSDWKIGSPPIASKGEAAQRGGLYSWDSTFWRRALCVAIFLSIQALFIWGEDYRDSDSQITKLGKVLSVSLIATGLLALLVGASLLSFLEFGDRTLGLYRGWAVERGWFWHVVVASWFFWLAVVAVCFRKGTRANFGAKALGALLAGSWLSSVFGLMIDLAIRPRYAGCFYLVGTWLALIISVPILVWAIGPALYLLFLRERRLANVSKSGEIPP